MVSTSSASPVTSSVPPPPPPPPRVTSTGPKEDSTSIKGFVGGTVSGLTKLAVGHPWDTLKVRLQCSPYGTYKGPLDAFLQLVRKESFWGLYKGASPPAVGWVVSDAVLMFSRHNYCLALSRYLDVGEGTGRPLPVWGHAVAGLGAGWTNSFVTTPVELIKAKLQMQHQRVNVLGMHSSSSSSAAATGAATSSSGVGGGQAIAREFSGPIDCVSQIVGRNGLKGLWHALPATLLFRSSFAVMFGGYEAIMKGLNSLKGTPYELSSGTTTFLAGGLAAELFWLTAFPADTIKNRMMADSLRNPQYPTIRHAFLSVWNHPGPQASTLLRIRQFYTGFLPCLLRAFPTNAAALLAYETAMRLMGAEKTTSN